MKLLSAPTFLTKSINDSKYFYAVMMILLNMGAKYIELDLDESHRQFLSSKVLRRLLIFTISFVATKDVIASLIITSSFVIIVLNLFNVKSKYCVLPDSYKKLDKNNDGKISNDEIKKAYEIIMKAEKIK